MKKLITTLFGTLIASLSFAQSSATSPGTGHWVVIDSGYQVATTTVGQTVAPLHFYNTSTSEKITGMQFRVFYDKTAFTAVVPSLKISTSDQYLQYVDSNLQGFLTVTLAYTGSSSTFNYSNGATFDLTFTHAGETVWNNLDSIKTLKVAGVKSFSNRAATNWGNDTTLVVYSYGGRFNQKVLRFATKFKNITGTDAKNLTVSLEKRAKGSSTWSEIAAQKTNSKGVTVFRKFLDTTYWDVRIVVKGDTMIPGNVFSTADAQKINQSILGQYTPTGFDYYTMDVNGTAGDISIADVYSVYGRLAGRFSAWPNSKKDVMFFTVAEYDAINGATSNLTSTYSTINNFTYSVDGKDSITYYVAVKGDANSTGFKMARLTPIKITNPANAKRYIIDETVRYDFPAETIEVNMPKVTVEEGNLVNVPVKVLTNGKKLGALQLDLKYDTAYLEFKAVQNTDKVMNWTSFFNPSNGLVSWGGADLTNENMLNDGEQAFTLQFIAKKPQDSWATAALWTGAKYVGDANSKDMNIIPAMGIVEVRRINKGTISLNDLNSIIVFPNPTEGDIQIQFKIKEASDVDMSISDEVGRRVQTILKEHMPAGKYKYSANLDCLSDGIYILSVTTETESLHSKIIVNK
jgi:Secretion system C-terminal sorting domain/Cohesin domain